MRGQKRSVLSVILAAGILAMLPLIVRAQGPGPLIPGANFAGGDGSYRRVLRDGMTEIVAPDPPGTFLDPKTHQYDGTDVRIFREVTRLLGIQQVRYLLVPPADMIPALLSKKGDVIVDDLHETPKRLEAVGFTGPAFWYGEAFGVPKGNPKHIRSWADLAGKVVGGLGGALYY